MKSKIIGSVVSVAGAVLVALAMWIQGESIAGRWLFGFYFERGSSVVSGITFVVALRFFVPALYKESTFLRFGLLLLVATGCVTFGAAQAIVVSILALLGWVFLALGIRKVIHGIPMMRSAKSIPREPNKSPQTRPTSGPV
jgi:hypothetical protein